MIVRTETGSVYELRRKGGAWYVRRTSPTEKRGDGEWLRMFGRPRVVDGCLVLHLQPLSELGPDDHGNRVAADVTVRTTSGIVSIAE